MFKTLKRGGSNFILDNNGDYKIHSISIRAASSYGGGFHVFLGLLTILISPFVIRIYCELLIVFFKVLETLQDIKEKRLLDKSAKKSCR